jgi:hypothetical protein
MLLPAKVWPLQANQYYRHGIFAVPPEDATPNKNGDIVWLWVEVESTLLDYEKSKVREQWNTLINQNPQTFLDLIYYHDTSPLSHF